MATYTVDKIEYNSNVYVLQDSGALQLTGGSVTGPVTFGDTITVDDATLGTMVVNGNASFTNNIQANTINGVTVGSSPKFTDTNTEVSTLTLASGSTAGTALSHGGKYTLTAGTKTVSFTMPSDNNTTYTFANGTNGFKVTPSGGTEQTVTVTPSITNNVTGSGTSGYLAKFNGANTITNGPALGSATTTYLRNDGSWATPTNTNTTYTLSGALSSHKFTSTLTAGGSGSGTSTSELTLAAGTGISITDDTTNKKMTIACSVTNTDTKMKFTSVTDGALYPVALGPSVITSGNAYEGCYSGTLNYTPNEGNLGVDFINSVNIASALTTSQNGIMLCDYQGTTDIILDPLDSTNGTLTIDTPSYNIVFDMDQVEQLLTVTDTSQGTNKFLRGDGSWAAPSITLNGSSTTSPSFYAPTGAGTSGQYLKSSGSGAPTWAAIPVDTDEKVKLTSQSTSGSYPLIFGPTSITSNSTYQGYYNTGVTVDPNTKTVTAKTFAGVLTGGISSSLFVTETHDLFASTSISGGGHKYGTVDYTKTGYYPLAIAGWNAPDTVFLPSRLRLSAQGAGTATVAYDVYNPRSSSQSSKFIVYILWLKTS